MLPSRVPRAPLRADTSARFAIIGAGFTGVAVARRLAELDPSADILLLEGSEIGEGAAGRNSGFITPRDKPAGTSQAEIAQTEAVNRLTEEGFGWLETLITRHAIDCALERSGRIIAAATEAGAARVHDTAAVAAELGIPHAVLTQDDLHRRIGSRYYRAGYFSAEGYLMQPAALIRGLADTLPPNVRLHENTGVSGIERAGSGWRLTCGEASVRAATVILAANAAIRLFGYLRDRLVTIYTYAAITEAMSDADAATIGEMPVWGLLPAHRLGTTVRRIGPRRIMVRSLYSHERPLPIAEARAELASCFSRRYPALAHVGQEFVWGGTTALTMNGAPWWGEIEHGLYASAGCNGSGVVKGTVLGKRMAEMLINKADASDIRNAYGTASWVAPEPFRSIGFRVVSTLERRKAGAER